MSTQRNAPCPCGSGKKYKHCHLDKDESTQVKILSLPVFLAVVGIVTGSVLCFTHEFSIGGPVIVGSIVLSIAASSLLRPPDRKANTDNPAALNFGKK
jgi:hypothetical protein